MSIKRDEGLWLKAQCHMEKGAERPCVKHKALTKDSRGRFSVNCKGLNICSIVVVQQLLAASYTNNNNNSTSSSAALMT